MASEARTAEPGPPPFKARVREPPAKAVSSILGRMPIAVPCITASLVAEMLLQLLTRAGRAQLEKELAQWQRLSTAVGLVIRMAEE